MILLMAWFCRGASPKELYISLNSVKRALYPIKRALHSINEALHSVKKAVYSIKELYFPSKEPYIPSKELYIPSKERYIPSKEPCIPSKELYIPSIEPCFLPKDTAAFCEKMLLNSVKRAVYSIKKESYPPSKDPNIPSIEPSILSTDTPALCILYVYLRVFGSKESCIPWTESVAFSIVLVYVGVVCSTEPRSVLFYYTWVLFVQKSCVLYCVRKRWCSLFKKALCSILSCICVHSKSINHVVFSKEPYVPFCRVYVCTVCSCCLQCPMEWQPACRMMWRVDRATSHHKTTREKIMLLLLYLLSHITRLWGGYIQ